MHKNLDLSLYLIVDPIMCGGDQQALTLVEQCIQGGVSIVQLRTPTYHKLQMYQLACKLKPICKQYKVPLIIDDHLDIALAIDADGLHVGQKDLPIEVVRKFLPKDKIVGLSVTTIEHAINSNKLAIDYVGIGAIISTSTKPESDAIGFAKAKELISIVNVPSVLIGGIKLKHIKASKQTYADGICVVSALCTSITPKETAQAFKNKWLLS